MSSTQLPSTTSKDYGARIMLLVVAVMWGVNFVAAKFALQAFGIWTFRTISFGLGAGLLALAAPIMGISLKVDKPRDRLYLAIAGLFSCAGFGAFSAIALLNATTGRTAICVYTMPIWVTLLSRLVLKEQLTKAKLLSLALGITGLTILLIPLLQAGISFGAFAAIGAAISWAIGTIILKWAKVKATPLAIAVWQVLAGAMASGLIFLLVNEQPWGTVNGSALAGLIYSTLIGTAVAYLLWFQIIERLPSSTASLGTLLVPVFGVIASFISLNEIPSLHDVIGFTFIFVASLVALRFS
jgi:drug/metabolite transporter (DMT)-like permease